MKMKAKALAFYFIFLVGGVAVFAAGLKYLDQGLALAIILIWFFAFGISQFFIFRCAHCGKSAIKTPSGLYVPWVGNECRYCKNRY
jgi:hypothetical protein